MMSFGIYIWYILGSYADENLRLELSSSCDVDNLSVAFFDVQYTWAFKL